VIADSIIIPKFIAEYLIYTFLFITLLEGIIINLGLKRKWYLPKGLLLSLMLNFATTFLSFFLVRLVFFENLNYNFLMGLILCTGIEYFFADFMIEEKVTKVRIFTTILIANLCTFILLWANSSWLF
jgi:hypothetical protein